MSTLHVDSRLDRRSHSSMRRTSPRSSHGEWTEWPFDSTNYTPHLESGADINLALEQFEAQELSQDTTVRHVSVTATDTDIKDVSLDLTGLARSLQPTETYSYRFYFISRFLLKKGVTQRPRDLKKLQISAPAFRLLVSEVGVPPAFVGAVSRVYQPCGRGSRCYRTIDGSEIVDYWYILPVRAQVSCIDTQRAHASSTAGSNQMDPFNYLHLPDEKLDTCIAVSSQDGRWSRVVEEPQRRIIEVHESFKRLHAVDECADKLQQPIDRSCTRLEKRLQQQIDHSGQEDDSFNNDLSKALHTMAAHLHRYGSELGRLGDIIELIDQQREDLHGRAAKTADGHEGESTEQATRSAMFQIKAQLKDVDTFRQELEHKTQNILALLFNNIQVLNDKTLVANGKAMNKMLRASRAEAQMSMKLAEEMKKDSVAMKTIALLTVFFLPGTSFAAVLSMPFFSQDAWMGHSYRMWLWIVLTIPSTALAFAFYLIWKKKHDIVVTRSKDESAAEMGEIFDTTDE